MSSTILQTTFLFKPHSSPFPCRRKRLKISRNKPSFLASASDNPNEFSWDTFSTSLRRGSQRFLDKYSETLKKETGVDFGDAQNRISTQFQGGKTMFEDGFNRLKFELVPEFITWNKWDNWKDVKNWKPERLGALVLYLIAIIVSSRTMYTALKAPRIYQEKQELTEAYMEALIPDPTPTNIRRTCSSC